MRNIPSDRGYIAHLGSPDQTAALDHTLGVVLKDIAADDLFVGDRGPDVDILLILFDPPHRGNIADIDQRIHHRMPPLLNIKQEIGTSSQHSHFSLCLAYCREGIIYTVCIMVILTSFHRSAEDKVALFVGYISHAAADSVLPSVTTDPIHSF